MVCAFIDSPPRAAVRGGSYRGSMIQHLLRLINEVEGRIDVGRHGGNSNASVTQISSNRELLVNWPQWSLDQRWHALRSAIGRIVVAPGPRPSTRRRTSPRDSDRRITGDHRGEGSSTASGTGPCSWAAGTPAARPIMNAWARPPTIPNALSSMSALGSVVVGLAAPPP